MLADSAIKQILTRAKAIKEPTPVLVVTSQSKKNIFKKGHSKVSTHKYPNNEFTLSEPVTTLNEP